jgi:hypothetical protein
MLVTAIATAAASIALRANVPAPDAGTIGAGTALVLAAGALSTAVAIGVGHGGFARPGDRHPSGVLHRHLAAARGDRVPRRRPAAYPRGGDQPDR